jgi:phage shock protein A
MSENEIAIESGIKVEMAESLMSGLKNLFVEHNVTVSEETVDVVENLETTVTELEGKANDLVNENIELQKEIATFKAVQKFDEISEGLSVNQVERLKVLSEKLDVEDTDAYAENLSVIKESFFSDKPLVEKHDVQAESDEIILEEQEVTKPSSDYTSINALVEAFNTKK